MLSFLPLKDIKYEDITFEGTLCGFFLLHNFTISNKNFICYQFFFTLEESFLESEYKSSVADIIRLDKCCHARSLFL